MLWTKNLSSNSDLIAKKDRSHNFKFFRLRRLPDYMVYTEHILLTTWASNCTYMSLLKTANYLTLQLSIFPLKAYFQHKVQWAEHIPWVYILLLTAKLPAPCTRRSLEWSKKWTTAIKNFHLSRLLSVFAILSIQSATQWVTPKRSYTARTAWRWLYECLNNCFVSSGHFRDILAFGAGANVKLPVTQLTVKHSNIFQHSHWWSLSTE